MNLCVQCHMELEVIPHEPIIEVIIMCPNCEKLHEMGPAHVACSVDLTLLVPTYISAAKRAVLLRVN